MSDRIHTRIDPALKQNVSTILADLGLTEADAIRIFYKQIEARKGLPFNVRLPNKETLDAFAQSDDNSPKLKRFDSFEEFDNSLNS